MKISKKIIDNLKKGGVDFYLSVPCKLLANMIDILENDKDVYYSAVPREEEGCLLYTSPSPRDKRQSRMPSSA